MLLSVILGNFWAIFRFKCFRDILIKIFDKRQKILNFCFKAKINLMNNVIKISIRAELFKQIKQNELGRY